MNIKPHLLACLASAASALLLSCARQDRYSDTVNVIPEPQQVRLLGGRTDAASCVRNDVTDSTLSDEEYRIFIKDGALTVTASSERGFLYAGRTLRQLRGADGSYPDVEIRDWPRFAYRGMHLDCSRHFFSVQEVKRYLDMMALHKLNVLHWHLTDDQGWRIEIKSWPKLTGTGAWREGDRLGRAGTDVTPDGKRYGGFYTQEELRSIVSYAAGLGIDIMPEIDLPGHMLAALASYPELGCTGGPYKVWAYGGVSEDVLCAGNETTFRFIEDVLSEVLDIFPYEYVHIGGDECPKTRWAECPRCQARIKELGLAGDPDRSAEQLLQGYVTERVSKFLKDNGRRMVGWDEILEGNAPDDAVVMSWRGSEGGIKASELGRDVIMTPNTNLYFDYCQAWDPTSEPEGIGGFIPVWKVYEYEPFTPGMSDFQRSRILGVQANLWTEFISSESHLEYMLLPRMSALSEVQWCEPERKSFDRFMKDMTRMVALYEEEGFNYARHIFGVIDQPRSSEGGVEFTFHTAGDGQIRYTLDGTDPTVDSPLYSSPVLVTGRPAVVKAAAFRDGNRSEVYSKEILANKAFRKGVRSLTRKAWGYEWQPDSSLVDGLRGGLSFNTSGYVSWNGEPMDVLIDLASSYSDRSLWFDRSLSLSKCTNQSKRPAATDIVPTYSSVTLCVLVDKLNYIFAPSSVEVSLSDDGESFETVSVVTVAPDGRDAPDGLREIQVAFPETRSRFARVKAQGVSPIPDWHPGRGHSAFVFVDEVVVQ